MFVVSASGLYLAHGHWPISCNMMSTVLRDEGMHHAQRVQSMETSKLLGESQFYAVVFQLTAVNPNFSANILFNEKYIVTR